jgi:site-specific DNA-methyltransferase (adenine-specific)
MTNKVHLIDNMEFMARIPDNAFDLAPVDPPYFSGPEKRKYFGNKISPVGVKRLYKPVTAWKVPRKEYFDLLKEKSRNQIIWGANYFAPLVGEPFKSPQRDQFSTFLKEHPIGWIVWDKVNYSSTFNDCELALTSFDRPSVIFRYMWNGMLQGKSVTEGHIQQGNKKKNEKRIHPTQKPVVIYKWQLKNYANPGDKIFDSHVGSGSIRIACHDMGFDFTGCELDPDYWQDQEDRYRDHIKKGPELFEKDEYQRLIYDK